MVIVALSLLLTGCAAPESGAPNVPSGPCPHEDADPDEVVYWGRVRDGSNAAVPHVDIDINYHYSGERKDLDGRWVPLEKDTNKGSGRSDQAGCFNIIQRKPSTGSETRGGSWTAFIVAEKVGYKDHRTNIPFSHTLGIEWDISFTMQSQ